MKPRAVRTAAVLVLALGAASVVVLVSTRGNSTEPTGPELDERGNYLAGESEGERELEASIQDLLLDSYLRRSFPEDSIALEQASAARQSFNALPLRVPASQAARASSALRIDGAWRALGPTTARLLPAGFTPGRSTRSEPVAGRVTSLAVGPRCVPGDCLLWVGSAGGGVFRTADALANVPAWTSASEGLQSNAIGSLARDPSDPTGRTIYVGTGEANSSGDSSAGLGVYKSTDAGATWSQLAGSLAIAGGAAVSGVIVDPRDPQVIYVATTRAILGGSSVGGGQSVPPRAPSYGVYRSTDGGATFTLYFSRADPEVSNTATKRVNQIALDPVHPETMYVAVVGEGLFRRAPRLDGGSEFEQIFAPRGSEAGGESRTVFALARTASGTRIYVGSSNPRTTGSAVESSLEDGIANLYRLDNAGRPAAELADGWTLLSNSEPWSSGYASYRYCQSSCDYANFVASPPGKPDEVWLGGQFDYNQAYNSLSAGRTVMRSVDGGATFSDVTRDARETPFEMHPDQHAIVFSPTDPDIAFIGSDGGVVRTRGGYTSAAGRCPGGPSGLEPQILTWCRSMFQQVIRQIDSLNSGLDTLQLNSASTSPNPATPAILIGTQDNGTWSYTPSGGWENVATGDGGQSGIDVADQRVRFHTTFQAYVEINHSSGDPDAWRAIWRPLFNDEGRPKEHVSFYMPIVADPSVGGTLFLGMQHVWRTQRSGGDPDQLLLYCEQNPPPSFCGDWVTVGPDLTSTEFGMDRREHCEDELARRYCYIVAVERAAGDRSTLWAATLQGRVFVSKNADGPADSVTFSRVDVPQAPNVQSTPGRFVSGIAVDPQNPNHAWITYSGYDAHTPLDTPGHVFEVIFNPTDGTAAWKNLSFNLGDQPITDVARDPETGDLYASNDFGVTRLPAGATAWTEAATGLPLVAVYGLTLSADSKTLYAATHGRGLWAIDLP